MKLTFRPYTLQLKEQFTLATSSRNTTPAILVEIEQDGVIGYGEASLPPYLKDTQESVSRFLSNLNLQQFCYSHTLDEVLDHLLKESRDDSAAKAAVDIALHDLYGKQHNVALHKLWNCNLSAIPPTSYTIGIASEEDIRRKTRDADQFKLLKVKLGRDTDKMIINTIRSVTDKPLCVDVNQGWTDKHHALDMLQWCHEQGVVFAEQPMPAEMKNEIAWLTERSPIPVIADEAFQRLSDLDEMAGIYSGINIKLMKCEGLGQALKIIQEARKKSMKILLGCMTETSCAISAASQISSLVDWTDLDGALLISNDCFDGAKLSDGRIVPPDRPGIGVLPI